MFLVLSRHVFIEKDAAQLNVTMPKHSGGMACFMWYIKLLCRNHSVEDKFLHWPL